jgi:hypothetical protein
LATTNYGEEAQRAEIENTQNHLSRGGLWFSGLPKSASRVTSHQSITFEVSLKLGVVIFQAKANSSGIVKGVSRDIY